MRSVMREPVILTYHDKPHAALLSIEDLEDLLDGRMAKFAETGENFLSPEESASVLGKFAKYA